MKWLHLSDLHFNPDDDGTDSNYLRDKLKDFLYQNQVVVDYLILSGDFRDASCQDDTDENAQKVAQFILGITKLVGITNTCNILCVPGNHDLNRDYNNRQELLITEKSKYQTEKGRFVNLPELVDAFSFYKKVLNFIYGTDFVNTMFDNCYKISPHKAVVTKDCNILLINTELLAGQSVEDASGNKCINDAGTLMAGSSYVLNELLTVKPTEKITIAVGHRGLDLLEPTEKRKLVNIFNDYGVCLYLCGHSHTLWVDDTLGVPQVTVGCIKQENGVRAGFSLGEFCVESNNINISAYSWENNSWNKYQHFYKGNSDLHIDLNGVAEAYGGGFDNKIKIVLDGRVREFYCRVPTEGMKFWIEHSPMISVGSGSLTCVLKNNQYTHLINYNHTFILSNAVWKVIGIDSTISGVTKLTCNRELKGPSDDFKTGIANKDLISNYRIELLSPIENIGVDQKIELLPLLIKDYKHIKDAKLLLSVSNQNIIASDKMSIIGKSIGKTDILIWWEDDDEIFLRFSVNVCDEKQENVGYRLYREDLAFNSKSYFDYSVRIKNKVRIGVEKYINGEQVSVDKPLEFCLISKEDNCSMPIQQLENSVIEVDTSAMSYGKLYSLTIKGETQMQAEICGKGLF